MSKHDFPTGLTPLLRDLMFEVLPHFGLEHLGEDDMLADNHRKNISEARAVCMYLARAKTPLSYPELGQCFRRDHTSVMSAVRKIERLLEREPNGHIALATRAVLVSFQPERFEAGSDTGSGARELNFGPVPVVKIELDLERELIGEVA